ncbi:MarR family transcriptional regulator [Schleiferiaceae bacterium]|jgi:DNA-binding MarR family transcriptional regulator|nr:MarR family transcriptional regulator [Schleiferiaceae bacterium]MDC3353638.1 MarR family transcriptional regulator [Schleiferiaceae bacterium]
MKSLQEEIQQRKWQNDQQLALINVLYTYHWLKDQMTEALKPYKITMQQYNVLRILRGAHPDGMAAARIRERLLDKTSDVSRLLDRLEKNNLVERQASKDDKRMSEIFLTLRGLEILGQIRSVDKLHKEQLPKSLNDEEAQLLSALLDKMRG